MNELIFLSATSMAEQVRNGKISPVDLVDAHLAQIEKLNPKLNAFVQIDAERARKSAQNAESRVISRSPLGPLHGVPLSIKSSISVAGLRCEAGTRLREGYVADQDAPLVTRLKDAGAIILGATNTPELLMAWETDN
ncbi:MAG: amidase family protein, partial [Candidatus Sulfotelmatobacter sp.]